MMMRRPWPFTFALAVFGRLIGAQFPPQSNFSNVLQSPIDAGVTISYKQPVAGTCTTAYSSQKQYTGYINLPPFALAPIQQNYSINSFFWFIEARQSPETAPLTIWLNGGPGTSSMFGLFNEVGPCEVVRMADGTYGTRMRPFGWDRASNILFIDQPNQVGFSYDTATNASFDLFQNAIFEPSTGPSSQLPPFMYLNGTFGTANSNADVPFASTANTTEIAAAATWHFLQTWLSTFPQYNPSSRPNNTAGDVVQPAGINLFTESYGGRYGPMFASYFDDKNAAIANGTLSRQKTVPVVLQSLGIINGLVEPLIQDKFYPTFAYNNTYGIQMLSLVDQLNGVSNFTNQCAPAIQACRAAGPDNFGDDTKINALCNRATSVCNDLTLLAPLHGYDPYDIRQKLRSPDPPAAYQEYLNDGPVLASIGARVNFTETSNYVAQGFLATGDLSRDDTLDELAGLLARGVRIAFIYGDADFICNWQGGQAVANALANTFSNGTFTNSSSSSSTTGAVMPKSYAGGFAAAGFADIVVNSSYVGGAVKQFGNLSFSRIYDAGHFVPYYQPETAFQVFARIIFGHDLSTGVAVNLTNFGSSGTVESYHTNTVPSNPPAQTCWVRSWNSSCSADDTAAMLSGKGVVQNGIYYEDPASIILPTATVAAGFPGQPMTTNSTTPSSMGGTSTQLTGVYTATGTPTPSSAAMARPLPLMFDKGALSPSQWSGTIVMCAILFGALPCAASLFTL
jgi:carboxypeptidase C (cathepsin A)